MERHKKIQTTNNGHTATQETRPAGNAPTWKKTNQIAKHLAKVFTPHPRNNNDDEIEAYLDAPC